MPQVISLSRRTLPRNMVPPTQLPIRQLHWLRWKNSYIPLARITRTKDLGSKRCSSHQEEYWAIPNFWSAQDHTMPNCHLQSAMSDMSIVSQHAGIFPGIHAGFWKETNFLTSKFKFKNCSLPDASTSFWLQDKSSKQRSTRSTWPTSVATAATPKSHRRLWCRCRVLTLAPPSLLMGSMAVTCGKLQVSIKAPWQAQE